MQYEVALTLRAMATTGHPTNKELATESNQILERLGVISLPTTPLP